MNVHSLPSALPGLGVSLGAASPTPRGCWAWTKGLGLCWSRAQPYSAKISSIGGLLS